MQQDFTRGSLANPDAVAIIPAIKAEIESGKYNVVLFTRDTHKENYLETMEGKKLPIVHCIEGTEGWGVEPALRSAAFPETTVVSYINKPNFGWKGWENSLDWLLDYDDDGKNLDITLVGTCTDICILSNAIALKFVVPEADIKVLSNCCAASGLTPEERKLNTETALRAMHSCQIDII